MKKVLIATALVLLSACSLTPAPEPTPAAPTTVETANLVIKVDARTSVATLKAGSKPVLVCAKDKRYSSPVCDGVYGSETLDTGSDYGAVFTEQPILLPAGL